MRKTTRLILALALFFIGCFFVFAQEPAGVLKAILIIEDQYNDPGFNDIAESVDMDYNLVCKFLDTLVSEKVIAVEKTLLQGSNATHKNIVTLLKNIRLASDNVLFVYFAGHGGMENKNTFLLTAEGDMLYRNELESLVKNKPARFAMVFTDACSSSTEAIGSRGSFSKKNQEKDNAFTEIYKNLFYNYRGLMYVTAATEGEYAWSSDDGGAFTKSLFYEVLFQEPKLSWEENFNEAKKRTQEKFTYMQNMGLLNPADLKDLQKRGISSQTPKAYSLPTFKNAPVNNNQTNQPPLNPGIETNETIQATIENLTGHTIIFYIDNNQYYDKRWSWDECQKKTIKAKTTMTLNDNKPVIIFFDNGEQKTMSYELTDGSYIFDEEQDGVIDLFIESTSAMEPDQTDSSESKDSKHDVGVGSIFE